MYVFSCEEHWFLHGSLNYSSILQLELFCQDLVLSFSLHRTLSLFQASDTIHLRNWTFLRWVLREDHCCTGDRDLSDHHSTMSTRWISPSNDSILCVLLLLRLPQLFSTCVAFSLVADMGIWRGAIGNWSMSFWCVCFAMTLIISIVDLCNLYYIFPFFWPNICITYTCYAALICLSASIIYSITYVQFLPDHPYRDRAIAAIAFSCIASVLYVIELARMRAWYHLEEIFFYEHTMSALLKVLETFVAGVIFAFLSNTSLYLHQPALEWCVAVYSICFILAAVVLLLNVGEWEYMQPRPFSIFQLLLTLLSVLLYVSSMVLWPLYQFSEELGGLPQRFMDMSCVDELSYDMCAWDQSLAVAVLTAINLLIYMVDLVYWARQVSVGTKDVCSAPDSVWSYPVSSLCEDIL
ncbi:myeloid-associated differentiation marker-like [Bubalus kerabau]|uniref:myeloid-associated differentiation marker-like n=1 Tax=Bubalus carabanensis TaxID=3119969 RepID=UPI00244EA42E|nr:myeloid-associated differentiation marker-like [Bubalus carabanensis]